MADYLETVRLKREQIAEQQARQFELQQTTGTTDLSGKRVAYEVARQNAKNRITPQPVKIQNFDTELRNDIKQVIATLNELGEALKPKDVDFSGVQGSIDNLCAMVGELPEKMPEAPEGVEEVTVKNIPNLEPAINKVVAAVNKLELNPVIKVSPPDVKVTSPKVDVKPIADEIKKLEKKVNIKQEAPVVNIDTEALAIGIAEVKSAINGLTFPVPNYVIPFKSSAGKGTQVQLESNGAIPVSTATVNYATKIDKTTTSGVIYIGKAAIGSSGASAVWQIKKLDTNTLALDKTWADGNDSFDNVWNNRGSLSYS